MSGESMAMLVICISAAHGDRGDRQHDEGTWDMMVEVLEKCVQDHGEHDVHGVGGHQGGGETHYIHTELTDDNVGGDHLEGSAVSIVTAMFANQYGSSRKTSQWRVPKKKGNYI